MIQLRNFPELPGARSARNVTKLHRVDIILGGVTLILLQTRVQFRALAGRLKFSLREAVPRRARMEGS